MRLFLTSIIGCLFAVLAFCTPAPSPDPVAVHVYKLARPIDQYAPSQYYERSLALRSTAQALLTLAEREDGALEVTIGGQKLKLQKHTAQGKDGEVYVVTEGQGFVGDFAKAKVTEMEVTVTEKVGQAALAGKDATGKPWLVTKKSPEMEITKTDAYKTAKKEGKAKLTELCEKIETLGVKAVEDAHTLSGYTHGDLTVHNLLFDTHVTKAYLIDWGYVQQNAPNANSLRPSSDTASAPCATSCSPAAQEEDPFCRLSVVQRLLELDKTWTIG
ncbi:hypothetical protein DAEQUDRAFT_811802, partial [Daedalea quercina L-15889]